MLLNTAGQLNVTGQPIKAAGWYGYARGVHTVAWSYTNFVGRIYIEASLSTNPTENDWFPIWLESQHPYTQYPFDLNAPTGMHGGDTGLSAFTFQGNLVWVRARVDRSYLPLPQVTDVGLVNSILLNY
jgi:hypothetical protein